ncbi:MAG: protein kinase [Planctomycetota bacterium]
MDQSDDLPLLDRLAEEFLERCRHGDAPTVDEFAERHPELEEELRGLLPTLRFLEEFKPRDEDGSQPPVREEPESATEARRQIGDYRILEEVGRGGMGVVYEAEQLSLGRRVALKVLPMRSSTDSVAIERFQREARAAARLQHPNIVPIIDVGSDGDVNYYAMQFVRGRSLDEVLEDVRKLRGEGAPPATSALAWPRGGSERIDPSTVAGRHYWRSVARIGEQACRALTYAHENGVIHRDIKPSNLLLDEQGTIWVTDFGLAKTGEDDLTLTGDFVGTLRFMSPERFKGQCDARADVFGIGATLYELLVLEPAFHSPDRLHLIQRISKEDPRSPRAVDPSVPVDLETIVLKSLEKDPRRRYQSAAELGDDLTLFLAHQPIRARRTSALGRAVRWVARNRALAIAAACLITILTLVAISATVVAVRMRTLAEEAQRAHAAVERELYRSQIQNATDAVDDGRLQLARQLLFATPSRLRGFEWRHLASRLDPSVGSPLPQHLRVAELQFSADGRTALVNVAAPEQDGHGPGYRVVDTSTWHTLFEVPPLTNPLYVALASDGATVVAAGTELGVWSVAQGRALYRLPIRCRFCLDLDPHGHLVAGPSRLELRAQLDGQAVAAVDEPAWWAAFDRARDRVVVAFERRIALFAAATLDELPGGQELPEAGYLLEGALSSDGSRLAIMSAIGKLFVFDVGNDGLRNRRSLSGYLGSPTAVTFSTDGRFVILGTTLGRGSVWDLETGRLAQRFAGHTAPVRSLAVDPRSGVLVSCDTQGGHRGWSFEAASLEVLHGHHSFVYPVSFSRDGACLVSGGWDGFRGEPGSLRWWDARSGDAITSRLPAGQFVLDATYIDDTRVVAAVQGTQRPEGAIVFDALSGAPLRRFDAHGIDNIVRVVAHPDGERIVTVGSYERAYLWRADTGAIEHEWTVAAEGSNTGAAAFSPDGRWLALARKGRDIAIVEVASGTVAHQWTAHQGAITGLSFAADGATLYSSSADATVGVWDIDGKPIRRLIGHGIDVLCVAVSPDGTRIASGGRAGNVLLWDAATHDLVARLSGHRDYVYALAWSPQGDRLASTSGDGTVRLWTTQTLAERVRERGTRARIAEKIEPQLRAELTAGKKPDLIDRRWQADAGRPAREKEVARQILMQLADG